MSHYQNRIREIAPSHDARHIEAYMRLTYGALDGLSPDEFAAEAHAGAACVAEGGLCEAEELARSFGL